MFGGHSDSWNPSYAAYSHPEFPYPPYYVDPASVHPSVHYGSAPNLAAMNLAGPPPPPPPPSEPLPTSSSGYPNLVQVNRTVSQHTGEHDYSANMDYMADVTSFPTYDSRGSVNDRVRCATPTFEGSGEPIVAGKEHDEIRPLIVTCMSSEQLEMCSKLNRCLHELSIFHGLKGINDIADDSERPGKEDDEMRKYPSKGVHDEDIDFMYRTNSDRPARSVTQTGDNSTMVTVVNTGTTLIRKHKKMAKAKDSPSNLQVTTTIADSRPASSSHSPAVETGADEDNGGMLPLPTLSSCLASKQSGSYYNNYNGKKSAMKWVRPLVIRPEKPLSVPEPDQEKDDEIGSAGINKRRLQLLSYVDWCSDNIPRPKKMTVEVKKEMGDTSDARENRGVTESTTSPEEASHSAPTPAESARTPGDGNSAPTPDPAESGDPSPPAATAVSLPAPSLAPSRFKPAFSQQIEKKAVVPRQTARSKINRGRGSMSLRIINGHRIGGDSRECYANLQGKCTAGIFCRFEHGGSTEHQEAKICARLLRGVCRPLNSSCPLDHSRLLPHQYPVCQFFLREDCADGATCQLVHVKHAPRSTVCQEFQQGTCTRGDECEYPHRYSYAFVKERGEYADRNMVASSSERVVTPEDDERVLRWIED